MDTRLIAVHNLIIKTYVDKGREMLFRLTPVKIQIILYIMQCLHMQRYARPLFDADMYATKDGVLITEIASRYIGWFDRWQKIHINYPDYIPISEKALDAVCEEYLTPEFYTEITHVMTAVVNAKHNTSINIIKLPGTPWDLAQQRTDASGRHLISEVDMATRQPFNFIYNVE